ncbi:MAG: putative ATP-dependent endonuclease of OLD family [Verrucomicrobiales bacterium]|jgi:predicted ATP-dependent endonuclease of OLD family
MYLRSIKLQGYRSFLEPVSLHLQPEITVLAGPDHCGKTSALDSIRWCLDDSTDEAVLFRGTDSREPATSASVSLKFTEAGRTTEISRTVDSATGSALQVQGGQANEGIQRMADAVIRITTIDDLEAATRIESPAILLLDEPEQWLPESEIQRLSTGLKAASQLHQIILATHSKSLMATADRIIGIIMREFGVSTTMTMS